MLISNPHIEDKDKHRIYCVLMMRYGVEEASPEGTVAFVPVRFNTRKVMKPLVVEAEAPVRIQPAVAAEDVAKLENTISPETTPVTAQSIGDVVVAVTVKDVAIKEQVPTLISPTLVGLFVGRPTVIPCGKRVPGVTAPRLAAD